MLYKVLNLVSLRLYFVWIYLFWNNYSFGNECTQNTCHVDSKFWRFGCLELKVPQNPPHSSRYKCTLISHLSNSLIFGIYQCKIFFSKKYIFISYSIYLFPWCSGYHICLTRRRSPVRSRTETLSIPRGLTARISGFHPEGPGSTPGVGIVLI